MKYTTPLGAILLLGLVADFHRPYGNMDPTNRQPGRTLELPLRRPLAVIPQEPAATPVIESATFSKVALPVSGTDSRKRDESPWRKLSIDLAQELSLTSLQEGTVEQILRDRSEEIRSCHEEIRKSGFLDVPLYEWQVARMKESWYGKIDGLLDGNQHQRFMVVVEKGFFNEGLGVIQEPGMTVLD